MRFLHTGDWHLGRTIRGQSRQPEFERTLAEVARTARDEAVDAVIIAGDTFDTFAPGAEAEKLLYETLGEVVRDGAQVVMIAGNHDSATRMDAIAGILRMVGVHSIGTPPDRAAETVLRVASRDKREMATVAALPWVPERFALRFETLAEGIDPARVEYRAVMEALVPRCFEPFAADTVNVFVGHLLIDGVTIGEGSGERKMHIGHNFAVQAACIPGTASYVALGHVHKRQQVAAASPAYYSGSLVQLDFGEGGFDSKPGQQKYVNVVDARPGVPAEIRAMEITGGRGLRTLTLPIDDLASHAGKYGDDYLRVVVQADRPVASLIEMVRDVLPNALDVSLERTDEPAAASIDGAAHRGLAPYELLGRFYQTKHNAPIPEPLVELFNELYEAEIRHAPA
jgi:exonuclease SbcD